MTIKELIKELQQNEKAFGDVPVVISTDEEGNSFSTLEKHQSISVNLDDKDVPNGIILYPFVEGFMDPTEAINYKRK